MHIKVKIASEYPHGACSYYRSMGVFPKLPKLDSNIQVEFTHDVGWQLLSDTDILVIERPQSPNHLKAIRIAKNFGIKIWCDFDDNFFQIPKDNPTYKYYTNKTNEEAIKKCVELADVVTVATPAIKIELLKYNKNIIVIENAFNDYNYNLEYNLSNREIIQWRGSNTHRNDLITYSGAIFSIAKEFEKWGWSWIGSDIWYMTEYIKNKFQHDEMNMIPYWEYIKNVNPAIQIVPLIFSTFNQGKSNIAWIEATYSGAVCLCPYLAEWKKPGTILYNAPEDFKSNLKILIEDKECRKENYKKSLNYIKENLCLSKINRKRISVIYQLLEKEKNKPKLELIK